MTLHASSPEDGTPLRKADYYSAELGWIDRASLFEPDGSLTEVGIQEGLRLRAELEARYNDTPAQSFAGFLIWRHNQWTELQQPGYLDSLPQF